jgi:hypothetical protein
MICLIEFQFSYTTRRVTSDRRHCVNESHSLSTLLAFTVGVSLPRAVLVKRPGGVFNLPVSRLSNLPVNQFREQCVRELFIGAEVSRLICGRPLPLQKIQTPLDVSPRMGCHRVRLAYGPGQPDRSRMIRTGIRKRGVLRAN